MLKIEHEVLSKSFDENPLIVSATRGADATFTVTGYHSFEVLTADDCRGTEYRPGDIALFDETGDIVGIFVHM